MNISEIDINSLIKRILDTKKYRDSGLNPDTIRDLIFQEAPHQSSSKKLLKSVKRKLHNIVAPYLGEPDYEKLRDELKQIKNISPDFPEIRSFCERVLSEHSSTAERLPYMKDFYHQLFQQTGIPHTIVDLACGLHPLAFPWMGLPLSVQYHAYDIIQPRVEFINDFFKTIGLAPLAENRDILVNPPDIKADLALIFKEAHRMEKRQPGGNRGLWIKLDAETLAVSLPTQDLSGTHSLLEQHRTLVLDNLPEGYKVEEIAIENELVFLIRKDQA